MTEFVPGADSRAGEARPGAAATGRSAASGALGATEQAELARLDGMMKADRAAWFRNDEARARHRALVTARDGGSAAPRESGRARLDRQIADYQRRMQADRAGWFKDDAARAHYAELIAARDGAAANVDVLAGKTANAPEQARVLMGETAGGRALMAEWGASFDANLAAAQGQASTMLRGMDPAQRAEVLEWFDTLSDRAQAGILRQLARQGRGRQR